MSDKLWQLLADEIILQSHNNLTQYNKYIMEDYNQSSNKILDLYAEF